MINITSKSSKVYTISLTEKEKPYMFRQIKKIVEGNENVFLTFNIVAREVSVSKEELFQLKAYNVPMNLTFKNVVESFDAVDAPRRKIMEIPSSDIEEPPSEPPLESPKKTTLYRKPIRSGQKEIFNNGIILTENINKTGEVVSYGSLVVLKKNHGTIRIEDGSLLIDPNKNFGEIVVNEVNISKSLLENDEIKKADRVLIEKTDGVVRYEIY